MRDLPRLGGALPQLGGRLDLHPAGAQARSHHQQVAARGIERRGGQQLDVGGLPVVDGLYLHRLVRRVDRQQGKAVVAHAVVVERRAERHQQRGVAAPPVERREQLDPSDDLVELIEGIPDAQ